MTAGRLRIVLVIVSVVAITFAVLWITARHRISYLEDRPSYGPDDADVVARAYRLAAERDDITVEHVQSTLYALVVHFPDKRCVELAPHRRAMGGSQMYCFSRSGNRLVERFSLGE